MKLNSILFTIYLLLTALLFISLNSSFLVWLSFFLNSIILACIIAYHLFYEKEYSPFLSSFIVFTFLFFIVAPIVQINSFSNNNLRFSNFFIYKEHLTIYTNSLIGIFNITFIISYILFKRKFKNGITKVISRKSEKILPLTILSLFIISLLVFFMSYNFITEEYSRPSWLSSSYSVAKLLIWKKVFFFLPFGGILLCYQYFRKENTLLLNRSIIFLLFLFFFLLLFWFKNPLTEKRNALGPIYISLIFLFTPKLLNSNVKFLFFLFFSMIIIFPLFAIITHTDATLSQIYYNPMILIEQMKGGGITTTFTTLNYDAFSNIMATLDYITKNGFSYGYQLLSAVLFFVPRSIWVSKPISTGQLVGEHLIDNFGFSFSNLSNPLISEGYINFGIIGVLLGAIIFAYIIVKMMVWLKSDNYLKKIMAFYLAVHLIFLLRGDFTNGFSYYIGPLVGVIFIPKIIEFIIIKSIFLTKHPKK
jgi:hypothetical protein